MWNCFFLLLLKSFFFVDIYFSFSFLCFIIIIIANIIINIDVFWFFLCSSPLIITIYVLCLVCSECICCALHVMLFSCMDAQLVPLLFSDCLLFFIRNGQNLKWNTKHIPFEFEKEQRQIHRLKHGWKMKDLSR